MNIIYIETKINIKTKKTAKRNKAVQLYIHSFIKLSKEKMPNP